MEEFEREVFINGVDETLPSMKLDDVKLLIKNHNISITLETLNKVLGEGNLDVFVYLCNLIKKNNPEYLKKYIDFLVKINLEKNNTKFIEYLNKKILIEEKQDPEKQEQEQEYVNINELFLKYCVEGEFEKLIELWDDYPGLIILHMNDEESFRKSCINGHLKIAQWLLNISESIDSTIDIRACNDEAFLKSNQNKHYDVVGWLASICSVYKVKVIYDNHMFSSHNETSDFFYNDLWIACGKKDLFSRK